MSLEVQLRDKSPDKKGKSISTKEGNENSNREEEVDYRNVFKPLSYSSMYLVWPAIMII